MGVAWSSKLFQHISSNGNKTKQGKKGPVLMTVIRPGARQTSEEIKTNPKGGGAEKRLAVHSV